MFFGREQTVAIGEDSQTQITNSQKRQTRVLKDIFHLIEKAKVVVYSCSAKIETFSEKNGTGHENKLGHLINQIGPQSENKLGHIRD
jgi:ABC-type enterochelin transport system substrate-binding protein